MIGAVPNFLGAALWPRLLAAPKFVDQLLVAVGIIVRHRPIAKALHLHQVHTFEPRDVFSSVTVETVDRLLTEPRYADAFNAVAAWMVARTPETLAPFVRIVKLAADAARKELFPSSDAGARGHLPVESESDGRDIGSRAQDPLTVLEREDELRAEREQEERWHLGTAALEKAVREWARDLTPRQQEVLHWLINAPKTSDWEIEVLVPGADRRRVVAPMRKKLDTLLVKYLPDEPEIETPSAPDQSALVSRPEEADSIEGAGVVDPYRSSPSLDQRDLIKGYVRPTRAEMIAGPGAAGYAPQPERPVEFRDAGRQPGGTRAPTAATTRRGGRVQTSRARARAADLKADLTLRLDRVSGELQRAAVERLKTTKAQQEVSDLRAWADSITKDLQARGIHVKPRS